VDEMKRFITACGIVLLLAGAVQAGTIEDEWRSEVWEASEQLGKAQTGRALLEAITQILDQDIMEFQALKDSGQFDQVPANSKAVLLQWFQILNAARTAIGTNANIMELYNFRP